MSDIVLSAAVRQNLLSLQSTADLLSQTQERLATGKKVNSALDNPTNFFTAQSLDQRATDISNLLDSVSNGVQVLQAASTGITSLTKLVQSAKATAQQALQAPNAYTTKATVNGTVAAGQKGQGLTSTDLTTVFAGSGTAATTGTGTVAINTTSTPNAAAAYALQAIASDTAATETGGASLTTTDAINLTGAGKGNFVSGDTVTISGVNGTQTLNITNASTAGTPGASDGNNIQADDTVTNLLSKLQALLQKVSGDSSATVALSGGDVKFQLSDNSKDFTLGGNAISKLGFAAGTYKPTNTTISAGTAATVTGATFSGASLVGGDAINNATAGHTLTTVPTAGQTITITGANGTQTLSFTASGAAAVNTNSQASTIGIDQTITSLGTTLQTLVRSATGDTGATVAYTAGTQTFAVTLTDKTKSFTLGGSALGDFGLTAGTTNATSSLTGTGASLTVGVGANASSTIYFGTATGQVQNRRDLLAQLQGTTGLSASLATSTNVITLSNATTTDFKSDLNVGGSASLVLTTLFGSTVNGVSVGGGTAANAAATATNGFISINGAGTSAVIHATNLLTQTFTGASSATLAEPLVGKTITVAIGSNSKTYTFGTGSGQISTLAELQAAVASQGGTLGVDAGNRLNIAADAQHLSSAVQVSGPAASTLGINTGTFNGTGTSLSGSSLTVTLGSGATAQTTTFTFGSATGQIKSLTDLNTQLSNVGVQASLDANGTLSLTTNNDNANETFSVTGTAATLAFGAASAFTGVASSAPVFGGAGDPTRRSLVSSYNSLLGQIDTLAQDSSYNGVNLLNGDDLNLVFNENGTSKISIKGVNFTSTGLNLTSLSSDGSTFLENSSINKVISSLDTVLNTLNAQSSKFGSNLSVVQTRQDFSKNLINVLQTGSSNLTIADTNEEAANSQALNTRQQLSVSALSLANQAQQSVLQLLR